MNDYLIVLVGGAEIGRVHRSRSGQLSFKYNEAWQRHPTAYPLSLSMPLALTEHSHAKVDAFLWGLLPDNERVIERWSQQYHVSPKYSFGLISHVGEDVAGAVQFVRPERMGTIAREGQQNEIKWLKEHDVAERLRALRNDHSAWRNANDTGQFSLAGAQPKTALLLQNGEWGIPSGRTPTNRILKPPTGEWDGHAENEHFCLELARALGFIVPPSKVMRFEDEIAIVIERYDRTYVDGNLVRVHQEDICQAHGLPPTKKYESEGGPGILSIVDLLRSQSTSAADDIDRFIDATVYNWLIAGTDAHAKNYSVLIGTNAVRLAPFYDLASILPYKQLNLMKAKMAMRVGGMYRIRYIGVHQWTKMAEDIHVDGDRLIHRIRDLTQALPDHIQTVRQQVTEQGLNHPLVTVLADKLTERALHCRALLEVAAEKDVEPAPGTIQTPSIP